MTKAQSERFGLEAMKLLNLQPSDDNFVVTSWGTKTASGLGLCLARLYKESIVYTRLQELLKQDSEAFDRLDCNQHLDDLTKDLGVDKATVLRVLLQILFIQ